MKALKRICIYPRDIQRITGSSGKAACKLIREIKRQLDKPEAGLVTIREFCAYTGISEDEVERFIWD